MPAGTLGRYSSLHSVVALFTYFQLVIKEIKNAISSTKEIELFINFCTARIECVRKLQRARALEQAQQGPVYRVRRNEAPESQIDLITAPRNERISFNS